LIDHAPFAKLGASGAEHFKQPLGDLRAGRIENLSPQRLRISAPRTFGWVGLSMVIAERRRLACVSNSTGDQRENMSRVF